MGAMGAFDEGTNGHIDHNIALGYDTLRGADLGTASVTVSNNIAIGSEALNATGANAQTGTIAIGRSALGALTNGAGNIAVGYLAAAGTVEGAYNTAIGYNAMEVASHADADNNTVIGYQSGVAITQGHNNTALGYQAGDVITTGRWNTIIGSASDPSANSGTNQSTLGYGVTGVEDDSVTLGNASVDAVFCSSDGAAEVHCGAIGIDLGTTSPSYPIHMNTTDNTIGCYMEMSTGNQIQLLKSTSGSPEGVDIWFSGITSGGTSNVPIKYRTDADKFKVTSNGAIYSTSTSVTDISSDQRLKKDIVDYTDGLSVIEKLKPRKYKWKNTEYHKEGQQYGFIAQENESIDNSDELELYSVYDIDNDNPESGLLDDGVMNTTSYGTKDAIYISAIQELLKEVQELSAKVAALEAK